MKEVGKGNKKYKVYRVNSLKMILGKGLEKLKLTYGSLSKVKKIVIQTTAGVIVVVGVLGMLISSSFANNTTKTFDYKIHVVDKGDTLSTIAMDYDVDVEDIIELNNIENPNVIEVGQKLKISLDENIEDEKEINIDNIINNWNSDLEKQGYVKGIDISFSNTEKNIDLETVFEENPEIKYVIVRSNYFLNKTRKSWETDEAYRKRCLSYDDKIVEYARIAKKHDVAFGIYYWPTFRGLEKTKQEIEIVMNKVKELEEKNCQLTLPIFMDIETKQDGGGDVCERIKKEHKETLECFKYTADYFEKNGYKLMLYTGNNTKSFGVHDLAQEHGVELWVSHYGKHNGMHIANSVAGVKYYEKSPHLMRQYSEGKVNGYNGIVDLDLAYINLPDEIVKNNLNNTDEIERDSKIKKFLKNIF